MRSRNFGHRAFDAVLNHLIRTGEAGPRLKVGATIWALVLLSGCSQLMGTLRPDLDDRKPSYEAPTVGGRWAERGFLSESAPDGGSYDRYGAVGHNERAPASMGNGGGSPDWIDSDRAGQNRMDQARGEENSSENAVSFENTPNLPPAVRRKYKNGSRATRADFIDESPNEGSLWASDGQTNYYFTKNKIRGVGDIVTISLEEGLIKDLGLEVRRTLTESERDIEMGLAEGRAKARGTGADKHAASDGKSDAVASSQAAPANPASPTDSKSGDAANGPAPQITPGDVDVAKSLELKPGDTMMAEIIERYPNGNYKVRGTKRVLYKNGAPRLVNLIGVVKGTDIAEDDTVPSGKLYEYRLEAIR